MRYYHLSPLTGQEGWKLVKNGGLDSEECRDFTRHEAISLATKIIEETGEPARLYIHRKDNVLDTIMFFPRSQRPTE